MFFLKPGFPLDFFLPSVARFWIFVPTKNQNEHCNVQMETSAKSQNEQPKAFTCFGF